MTHKDYSTIQRLMGNLEGIGNALPENQQGYYYDMLAALDKIIDRWAPKEETE